MGVFAVMLGLVVVGLVCSPAVAKVTLKEEVGEKETKLQLYGFSQFEVRGGDGWQLSKSRVDSGPDFQAQRIRVGFNYMHSSAVAGKLFLDFNQSHTSDEAGLPKMIKDAFVAYKFSNSAFLRLGMIKTPLGMSFTVPGWNLDNIERSGLDKGLVLERDFGVMLSGRLIGQENYEGKKQMNCNGLEMGTERQGYGFGYDIGVYNPAGRSSAVTWSASRVQTFAAGPDGDFGSPDDVLTVNRPGGTVRGDALAYVGRLHYDYGPLLHAEAAYGVSQQAGGFIDDLLTPAVEESEDYEVFDFGVASEMWDHGLELKLEYINGKHIRGTKNREQNTLVLTAGYLFVPRAQFMIKHYMAEHETPAGMETDLSNTYVGVNVYPQRLSDKHRDLQRHKIVLNYIVTGGDDGTTGTTWGGLGGYRDDTWGLQWQYKY